MICRSYGFLTDFMDFSRRLYRWASEGVDMYVDGIWLVQVGPLLHSSALLNPAHGDMRHLPSLLTITCNFSSHKNKKNEICKLVLSSADLSSAQACSRAENKQKNRALVPYHSLQIVDPKFNHNIPLKDILQVFQNWAVCMMSRQSDLPVGNSACTYRSHLAT